MYLVWGIAPGPIQKHLHSKPNLHDDDVVFAWVKSHQIVSFRECFCKHLFSMIRWNNRTMHIWWCDIWSSSMWCNHMGWQSRCIIWIMGSLSWYLWRIWRHKELLSNLRGTLTSKIIIKSFDPFMFLIQIKILMRSFSRPFNSCLCSLVWVWCLN